MLDLRVGVDKESLLIFDRNKEIENVGVPMDEGSSHRLDSLGTLVLQKDDEMIMSHNNVLLKILRMIGSLIHIISSPVT